MNGETIELVAANAKRITAAVTELRKAAKEEEVPAPAPLSTRNRLDALEQRCDRLVAEFGQLASVTPSCEEQARLWEVLGKTRLGLSLIERQSRGKKDRQAEH